MNPSEIKRYRKELIAKLKDRSTPWLKETGWIKSGGLLKGTPVVYQYRKVAFWKYDPQGGFTGKKLPSGETFIGFTDDGIATDCYMAIATLAYESMLLEDLLFLVRWSVRIKLDNEKRL